MDEGSGARTSASLLERLRRDPTDEAAWSAFVALYARKIHAWCRHWGLQEADAQDVTQNVLVKLADKMRTFTYDPALSFRAWLKTVAHHAWRDYVDGRRRTVAASADNGVAEALETAQARDDLLQRLQEEFDLELLERAIARVRQRVLPHTWEAFRLTAMEGQSGAEVAAALNMKVAGVFVAKREVRLLLQEEIRRLERDDPGPGTAPAET
jgi:RNA polymerase sigma-70 factor (ECF subfamily)